MEEPAQVSLIHAWRQAHTRTSELLGWLSDENLQLALNDVVGPVWRQFRHIGRVRQNYLDGLQTGRMVFGRPSRLASSDAKPDLAEYLAATEGSSEIEAAVARRDLVEWEGEGPVQAVDHLDRLVQHEALHHGQLIVIIGHLGLEFPTGWRTAWALPSRIR